MAEYAVHQLDDDGKPGPRVGEVAVDDAGMLRVVTAEAEARDALDKAVADLNGRPALVLKLPPSGEEEEEFGEGYGIRKEKVPRTDPRFFDAIQDNLRRWHAMELGAT